MKEYAKHIPAEVVRIDLIRRSLAPEKFKHLLNTRESMRYDTRSQCDIRKAEYDVMRELCGHDWHDKLIEHGLTEEALPDRDPPPSFRSTDCECRNREREGAEQA